MWSKESLTIGYLLPHKHLTGGLKMLLQQMEHLKKRGHTVYALYLSDDPKEDLYIDWYPLFVDKKIVAKNIEELEAQIKDCDIMILGWVTQIIDTKGLSIPTLYWEQGSEWLFGEIPPCYNPKEIDSLLYYCYQQSTKIISVSTIVAKLIKEKFFVDTPILSNGIDTSFYHPGKKDKEFSILLVGNPGLPFKDFNTALSALVMVDMLGYHFKVTWVSQTKPDLIDFTFPINHIIKPSQEVLAEEYRKASLFLFTSKYEGFGMPPLEAMASGTSVITTKCMGIDDYIVHGMNALTVEPGDYKQLAASIIYLLKREKERTRLELSALKTAFSYDYEKVIINLEKIIFSYLAQINS